MDYAIRKARDGDWHGLYRLHREAMGPYIEATWGPWDEGLQWRFFLSRVFSGRLRVIEVEEQTAGIIETTERPGAIYVDNLEIAAPFRGQGLGTALLSEIIADAGSRDLGVELQVLRVNPAKRLYERLGFILTGETETHFELVQPVTSVGGESA